MQTLYLKVDPQKPNARIMEIAASLIRNGETVAFPTETVYGVGADAMNERAVKQIFAAKGRRMDNPLLVHVDSWEQASSLITEVPKEVMILVEKFWPGPLTFIANSREEVPEIVRAGYPTVGLRMPDHRVALNLIKAAGRPIAATSANTSGRPSPTLAQHVKDDLNGKIAAIVNGGDTGWGIESTILDVSKIPFKILRPGAISRERLEKVLPGFIVEPIRKHGLEVKKIPHYQPEAQIVPVKYGGRIAEIAQVEISRGRRVGAVVITDQDLPADLGFLRFIKGGSQEYARLLYEILRTADRRQVEYLFMEMPEEEGLGVAVVDRIKEAGQR